MNAARFLNYLYLLLLFSTWPGLCSSGSILALLLVHGCHTSSSHADAVTCSDWKYSIFWRQLWKASSTGISELFALKLFACGGKQPVSSGFVPGNVYSCFQAESGNTSVIPFCLIFLVVLIFQLLSLNELMFWCCSHLAMVMTTPVIIAVRGFKLMRGKLRKKTRKDTFI